MTTLHRRRQLNAKHEPSIADLTLAYSAGVGTGMICALIMFGWMWR